MSLLTLVLVLPLVGLVTLLGVPRGQDQLIRVITLVTTLATFLVSLLLWVDFDASTPLYQYVVDVSIGGGGGMLSTTHYRFGVDGISLFFMLLTTLLMPVCILASWQSVQYRVREYCMAFLLLETLVLCVFSVLDIILFYVFFESVLLPMYLIIGIWGARERKIRAAYQFFLYTLLGSVLMLLGLLIMIYQVGSTDIEILYTTQWSPERERLLWVALFASFAVKVPMVPVHIWLPEAHVEAPTAGSLVLAGVLLKLGTYGFLRFSIPMLPYATLYFTPLMVSMSVVAIMYTSLTTLRQVDLKKIIAYSSVAHMNFVTLGLYSLNTQGIEGAILLMLSHGVVSPALFLCVGVLYDRHKTRVLRYYSGIAQSMPVYAVLLVFFTMANISLPGTSSFVGEFLVFAGIFQSSTWAACLAASGMVLGAAYGLWLCNRVLYGVPKPHYIQVYSDVTRREFWCFVPLIVVVVWMGMYPESYLSIMHTSVASTLSHGL